MSHFRFHTLSDIIRYVSFSDLLHLKDLIDFKIEKRELVKIKLRELKI